MVQLNKEEKSESSASDKISIKAATRKDARISAAIAVNHPNNEMRTYVIGTLRHPSESSLTDPF